MNAPPPTQLTNHNTPQEPSFSFPLLIYHSSHNYKYLENPSRNEHGPYQRRRGSDQRSMEPRRGRCFTKTGNSPSGSDASESSVPVAFLSHVYRPVPRTGGILPTVETTSSSNDPPTSLSLSLPGVDSCGEVSNRVTQSTHATPPSNTMSLLPIMAPMPVQPLQQVQDPAVMRQNGVVPFNFSAELLAVMQEMIKKEVRSYMAGLEQKNGMCYQAANWISRVDS